MLPFLKKKPKKNEEIFEFWKTMFFKITNENFLTYRKPSVVFEPQLVDIDEHQVNGGIDGDGES